LWCSRFGTVGRLTGISRPQRSKWGKLTAIEQTRPLSELGIVKAVDDVARNAGLAEALHRQRPEDIGAGVA